MHINQQIFIHITRVITQKYKISKQKKTHMGINQSLCLDQEGIPTYKWCKYEAIDNTTIIIELIFGGSLLVLAAIISRYYYRLVRYRKDIQYESLFGDVFVYVYYLIFGWLLCSLIKVFINIGVYYAYMLDDFILLAQFQSKYMEQNNNPSSGSPIVILSSVFYFFDYMCPYLLLLLMILIPYYWLKALLLSTKQVEQLSYKTRRTIQIYFTILKIIKYHNKYLMSLFPILLIAEPFILYFTQYGCRMGRVNSFFIQIQSLIILCFYIFGAAVVIYMRKNHLLNLNNTDLRKIKIQYFLLIYIIIVRIVVSYIFKLTNFYEYKPNKNCSNMDQAYQNQVEGVVALGIAQFIMHVLPISIILYVYQPNVEIISRDEMLLKYGSMIARPSNKQVEYIQENVDTNILSLTEQLKK